MYLEIGDVKRHLYIETNEDDLYIADLITVAQDAVKRDLNIPKLECLEDCNGMLPASITQAMLLLIGALYNNREAVSYGTPKVIPLGYIYLLDLYRNYDMNV